MIALIDCNNFYASCERVFNPALKNKPVAVLSNNDGCIVARSDEVKDLGIPMGAPMFKFKPLIKQKKIQVFSSNYELYGDMSGRVMQTIRNLCPNVEVYSIDEAFVDMTGFDYWSKGWEIKDTVYQHTGIPVSVGIAKTKVLAKAANRVAKKFNRGVHMVDEHNHHKLLNWLKVSDIWGIGARYAEKLNRRGLYTALDLVNQPDDWIVKELTIVGLRLVHELRGHSCLYVEEIHEPKKNIVCSRSFGQLVSDLDNLSQAVANHASRAGEKLRKQDSVCKGINVFIRTNKFRHSDPQHFAAESFYFPQATDSTSQLIKGAKQVLRRIYRPGFNYKKAGVMVFGISPEASVQFNLFTPEIDTKQSTLSKKMDAINSRHGQVLSFASCGVGGHWRMKRELKTAAYTTDWQQRLLVKI